MPDLATRTEAVVPPADCPDMETLRGQIDRIDRALVALVAERTGYIARAAEIKQRRDTVHDDARIEDVVAKVRRTAEALGVPGALVEPVWRELIARSIAYEFVKFDAKG
ncbi:MAG: chorismate mutase [Alphaproteobacteria bacterium]|nr:chorismate mutase [Alphaproteobacteria bacterium]